jgi:hypothetical protein
MTNEQRAAEAKQILNSELFKEALQVLESSVIEKIANCDLSDDKKLKALTGLLQSSRAFRSMFENWVSFGELESQAPQEVSNWQRRLQIFKRQ